MEKEWMKPPLPPLSESIIRSGLVTGKYKIANQKQSQPEKPVSRPRATSVTQSYIKPSSTMNTQRPQSDLELNNVKDITEGPNVAKTSRPLDTSNLNRSVPKPKQNKPLPIEQFHIYSQEERNQIIQEKKNPTSDHSRSLSPVPFIPSPKQNSGYISQRPPAIQNSGRKTLRSETNSVIQELENSYASILPNDVDINTLPVAKQAEIRAKLLHLHNFSFNNIILEERKMCEERALLLRRFHKFYNQQLSEIPALNQKINNYITEFNIKYDSLVEHTKQLETLNMNDSKENKDLKSELETLKNEMKKVTEESNQKDIQIQSYSFDLDYSKGQIAQLQFKLQEKTDEIQSLTKRLNELDEQNKSQFLQIDNLNKSISELEQADSGYLAKYHKEHDDNELLKSQLNELQNIIYHITNIEKVDIDIQTDQDDSQRKQIKKKKSPQKETKQKLSSTLMPNQIQLKEEESKYLASSTVLYTKQLVKTNPDYTKALQNIFNNSSTSNSTFSLVPKVETSEIEVQTDPVKIEPIDKNEPKEVVPEPSNEKFYSHFSVPVAYKVDHSKLDKIPDLFEKIMPILSKPMTSSTESELKVLSLTTNSRGSSKRRPVIWALQIIHNFLTDPLLRSVSSIDRLSTEVIFVNWLNQMYRLPHISSQVLSDFSILLYTNRATSSMLPFFNNVLMGKYSFSQLSFLSTIYSMSIEFTYPNLANSLQLMDFEEDPMIHIECIEKLIAKCFSEEISSKFVEENFMNPNAGDDQSALIPFTSFLDKGMELFGQEHVFLYSQCRDLLFICGCYDCENISFDSFVKFFCMLGANKYKFQYKTEWKKAISREQGKGAMVMHLARILTICAEKKKPLMELLEIRSLKPSVARIKSFNTFVSDLFYDLLTRYSTSLPNIIDKLPKTMFEKFKEPYDKIRIALLNAEIAKAIYLYRLVVMKIDLLVMEDKGFIPFNQNSNLDVLSKLTEYLDRSESVAFAMID